MPASTFPARFDCRPDAAHLGRPGRFCPPRAGEDALRAAVPGSRLVVYAGAGHALHWEEPARYAADVAAYVMTR